MYMGWSPQFLSFDVKLEQAMNVIDTRVDELALIQNALGGSPPGLLATLRDIEAKIVKAHSRFAANKVASIVLNREELKQFYREGKRVMSKLATLLGTEVLRDVWSGRLPRLRSFRSGNYQVHG